MLWGRNWNHITLGHGNWSHEKKQTKQKWIDLSAAHFVHEPVDSFAFRVQGCVYWPGLSWLGKKTVTDVETWGNSVRLAATVWLCTSTRNEFHLYECIKCAIQFRRGIVENLTDLGNIFAGVKLTEIFSGLTNDHEQFVLLKTRYGGDVLYEIPREHASYLTLKPRLTEFPLLFSPIDRVEGTWATDQMR